jgi:hypothetical protein
MTRLYGVCLSRENGNGKESAGVGLTDLLDVHTILQAYIKYHILIKHIFRLSALIFSKFLPLYHFFMSHR